MENKDFKDFWLSLGKAEGLLWVAQQLGGSPLLAGVSELLQEVARAIEAQARDKAEKGVERDVR